MLATDPDDGRWLALDEAPGALDQGLADQGAGAACIGLPSTYVMILGNDPDAVTSSRRAPVLVLSETASSVVGLREAYFANLA